MALATYSANGITYTVALDDDLPAGSLPRAVITVLLMDELTGIAPTGDIQIDSTFAGLTPRTELGGLAGLAGIPTRALPLLGLTTYHVPVQIRAAGYLDVSIIVTILQTPGFPGVFNAPPMQTISLHRRPTTLYGRAVVSSSSGITPVGGATVSMTGLWRTIPPANVIVPPDPPNVVSLNPPLYVDRPAAGTQVAGTDFLGAPGPDKQLLADAPAGQSVVRLSDCLLLVASDVLAIDSGDPEVTEFIEVQSILKSGADNLPATITLAYPLTYTHSRNVVAHKVSFQPPGPPTPLGQDAIAGDCCTFLTTPANLGAAPFVQVQGGPSPIEYHQVSRFTVTCNALGFFRLPPLSRVVQCKLKAQDGVHPDIELTVCPDYSPEGTRVDFVFQ
jgi:hypothetical protein